MATTVIMPKQGNTVEECVLVSFLQMIWGAVIFIENEMRVNDIEQIIFPHPTVSEAIKETIIH